MSDNTDLVTCPSCDGTGIIHSHNPLCGVCGGSGKCSQREADEDRRLTELMTRKR
jgi:RecJ-like exonuclease